MWRHFIFDDNLLNEPTWAVTWNERGKWLKWLKFVLVLINRRPRNSSWFLSMQRLKVIILPPAWWGTNLAQGYCPSSTHTLPLTTHTHRYSIVGDHLYTWVERVERDTVRKFSNSSKKTKQLNRTRIINNYIAGYLLPTDDRYWENHDHIWTVLQFVE